MAKSSALNKRKPGKWENIINEVRNQLQELRGQGISPTLRGIHYRMASLDIGYGNTVNMYKELSRQTARAREDGRLSINCFVDKGRDVVENGYMSNADLQEPEGFIEWSVGELENIDKDYIDKALPKWYNQNHYIEVWLEKAAQEDTFIHALRGRDVRIVPNRGYSSLTFIWKNCKRLQQVAKEEPEKKIHIRYFGDFDPSGEDMDRDIVHRIEMITGWNEGNEFDFERVVVTREQIEQYGLPKMPEDKETRKKYDRDPRKVKFESNNGGSYAVELDAIAVYSPDAYIKMIQDTVDDFDDEGIYNAELEKRSAPEFRKQIRQTVYDKTKEFLNNYDVNDVGDFDVSGTPYSVFP